MRSFYPRFRLYAIQKWPFSGTYPLINSHPWSFYMRIRYQYASLLLKSLSLAYNEVHLYFIPDHEMRIKGDHLWREKLFENERNRKED
jgi:hypothetical protein